MLLPLQQAVASRRAVGLTDANLAAATTFDIRTNGDGGVPILVTGAESATALDLDANQTLAIAQIKELLHLQERLLMI